MHFVLEASWVEVLSPEVCAESVDEGLGADFMPPPWAYCAPRTVQGTVSAVTVGEE